MSYGTNTATTTNTNLRTSQEITPGGPAQFDGRGVEKSDAFDPSVSALQQLSIPTMESPILKRAVTEPMQPDISPEIHKKMLRELQLQYLEAQNAQDQLKAKQAELTAREEELKEEKAIVAQETERLNAGVGGVLQSLDQAYKLDKFNPTMTALHLLKHNLPALENELKKARKDNTPEAKEKFVQTCSTIVGNAIKNALLIYNAREDVVQGSTEPINITILKTALNKSNITTLFSDQASQELLHFLEMAVNATKKETIPTIPTSKELWINRFYTLANSMYPVIAASGIYVAGKSEDFLLSFTPEVVNNFVLAIQEYVGAPTVPLLLFAIGYLAYYMTQLAYMAKERVRPTDEKTKTAAEEAAWANRFARHALAV